MNNKKQIVLRSHEVDMLKKMLAEYYQSLDPENVYEWNRERKRVAGGIVGYIHSAVERRYPKFNPFDKTKETNE